MKGRQVEVTRPRAREELPKQRTSLVSSQKWQCDWRPSKWVRQAGPNPAGLQAFRGLGIICSAMKRNHWKDFLLRVHGWQRQKTSSAVSNLIICVPSTTVCTVPSASALKGSVCLSVWLPFLNLVVTLNLQKTEKLSVSFVSPPLFFTPPTLEGFSHSLNKYKMVSFVFYSKVPWQNLKWSFIFRMKIEYKNVTTYSRGREA